MAWIALHQNSILHPCNFEVVAITQHTFVTLLTVNANSVAAAVANLQAVFADFDLTMNGRNRSVLDANIRPTARPTHDDCRAIDDDVFPIVFGNKDGDGGHLISP